MRNLSCIIVRHHILSHGIRARRPLDTAQTTRAAKRQTTGKLGGNELVTISQHVGWHGFRRVDLPSNLRMVFEEYS